MTLVVSGLQRKLSTVEVVVGKMIATEVVKESNALRSCEERKWRRLLVDIAEDLLCAAKLAAVEEELQAEVCCQIDPYPSSFGLAVTV